MSMARIGPTLVLHAYCLAILPWDLAVAPGPYQNSCDWSEWRCHSLSDGSGCYAQRSRLCCGANEADACPPDNYKWEQLVSQDQQTNAGVVCQRQSFPQGGCQPEPKFDGAKFPAPAWCPWTQWSAWAIECRAGLEWLPELAGLLSLGNDSNGFRHASRSRGCYCPANPDPTNFPCPGHRREYRANTLNASAGSAVSPGRYCHWCSWGAWHPPCECPPPPPDSPPPIRRRQCLCSDGQFGRTVTKTNESECGGGGGGFELAPSSEAVCPICSRLHDSTGQYRAAQFLNPLAIGFAVYLLVALAAFLTCKIFCGDPRQSDANSRDQLSVDDFLATPGPPSTTAL